MKLIALTPLAGMKFRSITCDGCRTSPVVGNLWKCSQCYDYDLCTRCYMNNKHSEDHRFVRHDGYFRWCSQCTWLIDALVFLSQRSCCSCCRSMMGCRRGAKAVESMGIFPPAEVVRGHDWSWGQQDGEPAHSELLNLHVH